MSGASVSLGSAASVMQWPIVIHAAALILTFIAGAVAAVVLAGETGAFALAVVLAMESVLLVSSGWMAARGVDTRQAIFAVVAAMGVQNTALQPKDGMRLGATFMTGTLVSMSKAIGEALLGKQTRWNWFSHASLWIAFTLGAGLGAYFYIDFGFEVVLAPAAVVAFTAASNLAMVKWQLRRSGRTCPTEDDAKSERRSIR
jgi:uncharacterized membrane protein YoaK (UPF0700 family)